MNLNLPRILLDNAEISQARVPSLTTLPLYTQAGNSTGKFRQQFRYYTMLYELPHKTTLASALLRIARPVLSFPER